VYVDANFNRLLALFNFQQPCFIRLRNQSKTKEQLEDADILHTSKSE